MARMQALLKIKADVQGEGQVNALGRAIGGLSTTAGKVSGGLKGLAGAAGGLSGAIGALVPVVSIAGLAAMGKGAIDAADDMNDLSQKTGVSVESLSKFQQAANASGTSIEGVGAAMIKLNRNLATGNAGAAEALTSLGISATDASGKLKSTDAIMLEVADKFAKMPDGAQKTALALQLFGKSGADMIPLLNGGRQAVESLSATMTTKFAQGADALNDKLATIQSKLLELGVNIGTALMPALNLIADLIVNLANGFAALPGPLQAIVGAVVALSAAFVVLAPAISSIISIAGALAGLQLGATIAGWLGAVGPMVAGITAALGGLLAWITGTLIPGLLAVFSGPVGWTILAVAAVVAMCIAFREPIMNFFSWMGDAIAEGVKVIWRAGEPIREFWVGLWENSKKATTSFINWLGDAIAGGVKVIWRAGEPIREFWAGLWENSKKATTSFINWLGDAWKGIGKFFATYVTDPISKGWDAVAKLLPQAMETAANFVKSVWTGLVDSIKGVVRDLLTYVANAVNSAVAMVNRVISGYNSIPNAPDLPLVPTLSVPAFAQGGVVSGPTLAMVGEGGPEYIIPASKMAAASRNYLAGGRGAGIMNGGSGNASINITTGPVVQMGGEHYVTLSDLERAMRIVADGVYASLRTPSGRYAVGVR